MCDELEIAGCQDGQACNFNPLATDPSEGFPYPGDCYYAGTLFAAVDGVQNVSCAGDSNGAFVMFATGGNAPYTLSIESIGIELSSEDFEDGISPGQACVFYNKDKFGYKVLGGGWIYN